MVFPTFPSSVIVRGSFIVTRITFIGAEGSGFRLFFPMLLFSFLGVFGWVVLPLFCGGLPIVPAVCITFRVCNVFPYPYWVSAGGLPPPDKGSSKPLRLIFSWRRVPRPRRSGVVVALGLCLASLPVKHLS